MQLILEPGFSTAGAITQQAGRGVGMDVVATEIKTSRRRAAHGDARPARVPVFTIRLPFTLAISHALVVRTGEEFYALPLPTVEGVVRFSKRRWSAHLGKEAPAFEYGGQKYRFQHLAHVREPRAFAAPGTGRHHPGRHGPRGRAFDRSRHGRARRQPRDRGEAGGPQISSDPRYVRRDDPW